MYVGSIFEQTIQNKELTLFKCLIISGFGKFFFKPERFQINTIRKQNTLPRFASEFLFKCPLKYLFSYVGIEDYFSTFQTNYFSRTTFWNKTAAKLA